MKKVEATTDEVIQLAELIKIKPQAEQKVKYYTNLLLVCEEMYEKIQERIKARRKISIHFVLGFIPVITTHRLDGFDVALNKREMIEMEDTVFTQKQYFENWKDRVREYDTKMEDITIECNTNFDMVLEEAKKITYNLRVQEAIQHYSKTTHTQEEKNQFFFYLKKEVLNSKVFNKKR